MNQGNKKHTFDELTKLSNKQLDPFMVEGTAPQLEDVVGYDFRGWNINPATKISGTRKFKKGFFGDPAVGHIWGYNVPTEQNGMNGPWNAKPNENNPRRYFFYKVFTAKSVAHKKHPNSLIVHYAKWGEYFFLNPVKYTVDYLVYPDPDNRDLMVGKAYFEIGPIKFFAGYFILERHNQSNYDRTTK